jgi:hypothetical protein
MERLGFLPLAARHRPNLALLHPAIQGGMISTMKNP